MKKIILVICCLVYFPMLLTGQGYNHQWLLGNYFLPQDPKGRMFIDSNNYSIVTEFRKMPFLGTQGNICDANGNFLMSSNGVWIADATNDTMMNGSGLNPNGITVNFPYGLPLVANNVFLPYPGDSDKVILIHHSATQFPNNFYPALELYYSTIDLNLNGGLGSVLNKNNIVFQDTLNWGIGACRHANGRDWWILAMKDSSDIARLFLFDSTGNLTLNDQSLGYLPLTHANVAQLTFSPTGNKFISSTYDFIPNFNSYLVICDFNRCSGVFSNTQTVQIANGKYIYGLAFSPSGEFAYACTETEIYQINTTTLDVETVAIYDGFISPPTSTCCPTTFLHMYLAADGKIYVTSGSSIRHFTKINYPDSAGIACDVQQHSVFIGNYAHLSAVPNHPNYYLGCDTTLGCPCLITGMEETIVHDFKFSISPNPSQGSIKLIYLLPQNQSGLFEVYDLTGKKVYSQPLPPWSTMQLVSLTHALPSGIYQCTISSGQYRDNRKLVLIRD